MSVMEKKSSYVTRSGEKVELGVDTYMGPCLCAYASYGKKVEPRNSKWRNCQVECCTTAQWTWRCLEMSVCVSVCLYVCLSVCIRL